MTPFVHAIHDVIAVDVKSPDDENEDDGKSLHCEDNCDNIIMKL